MYELMLQQESAYNIFILLMCRDIDLENLKGVIYDHACGLEAYLLNGELRKFQYIRCLSRWCTLGWTKETEET